MSEGWEEIMRGRPACLLERADGRQLCSSADGALSSSLMGSGIAGTNACISKKKVKTTHNCSHP
uniref:Uncharacterized protein n=1 Tax=Triticum urartu TaxID=4572 RepID=A0A8R7R2V4_TRIUA